MPTIFLSAATVDLKLWRDALHGAFQKARFTVRTQDHSLGAPWGDVRRLLADEIDQSDCVLHLAGLGYGSDAAEPFPNAAGFVCSWTQFEYYYAHSKGKDVVAFVLAPDLSEPGFAETGDEAERARKAALQQAHRARVASGRFDGTPLAGAKRTLNREVESHFRMVQEIGAVIADRERLVYCPQIR